MDKTLFKLKPGSSPDRVIPRQRTQILINHFPGQYVDSFVIKGADHNDISMFPDYVTGLKKALE